MSTKTKLTMPARGEPFTPSKNIGSLGKLYGAYCAAKRNREQAQREFEQMRDYLDIARSEEIQAFRVWEDAREAETDKQYDERRRREAGY